MPSVKPLSEKNCFCGIAVLFTLLLLLPIWWYRFLPMQDYPQHLLITKVLSTFSDPSYNWQQFYRVDLRLQPYSLCYLIMRFFAYFVSVETAGKLFVSLYILLCSSLVWVEGRSGRYGHVPWGMLLIFPFTLHQFYYMGFLAYLISMPLLFFALRDQEGFVDRDLTPGSAMKHLGWQAALFLAHPYTVLVYLVLASSFVLVSCRGSEQRRKGILAPAVLAVFFAWWYFGSGTTGVDLSNLDAAMRWQSPEALLTGIAIMFSGMKTGDAGALVMVFHWSVIGVILLRGEDEGPKGVTAWRSPARLYLVLTLLGYLLLPIWLNSYSYFNQRMAPVFYFCLAFVVAGRKLSPMSRNILVIVLSALLVGHFQIHGALSAEVGELMPLLAKMKRNAVVLPLYADKTPTAIDSAFFFDQFHRHDHDYYHVLVGGGANPAAIQNPLLPVQYRDGVSFAETEKAGDDAGISWQYVLVRGALDRVTVPASSAKVIARSGKWTLLEALKPRH